MKKEGAKKGKCATISPPVHLIGPLLCPLCLYSCVAFCCAGSYGYIYEGLYDVTNTWVEASTEPGVTRQVGRRPVGFSLCVIGMTGRLRQRGTGEEALEEDGARPWRGLF